MVRKLITPKVTACSEWKYPNRKPNEEKEFYSSPPFEPVAIFSHHLLNFHCRFRQLNATATVWFDSNSCCFCPQIGKGFILLSFLEAPLTIATVKRPPISASTLTEN